MSVKVVYQISAEATGGRDCQCAALDGSFEVNLTRPKRWSPRPRQVCPYSNATRNNIDVKLTLNRTRPPRPWRTGIWEPNI
jgi:lipoyl-dependent peroxiredoxin